MITGELKAKVDRIWDSFWSGGISNPLEVIEQITYLLFLRRLDDLQTLAEKKARLTGGVVEDAKFLPGHQHLRWSRFKNFDADVMYTTVATEVFPFLQRYGEQGGGDGSTYSDHMRDARFTIPTPALLSKVVAALGGTAQLLVIQGAAGAGKTTTLAAARELLEMQDTQLVDQPSAGERGGADLFLGYLGCFQGEPGSPRRWVAAEPDRAFGVDVEGRRRSASRGVGKPGCQSQPPTLPMRCRQRLATRSSRAGALAELAREAKDRDRGRGGMLVTVDEIQVGDAGADWEPPPSRPPWRRPTATRHTCITSPSLLATRTRSDRRTCRGAR